MKIPLCLAVLAATALPVSAQQVVFQDGFEGGLGNWTATGLWNPEAATDACGIQAAPFPEGTKAAWYGHYSAGCNYSTGTQSNAGSLELTNWVLLPDAPSISLYFWMWSESEYCTFSQFPYGRFDVHSTYVLAQSSGPSTVDLCPFDLGPSWLLLPWHERRIDLSAYRGRNVRIGFSFDTGDEQLNDGRGWFLDDVRIVAEPGTRVCPSIGFSSGCPCLDWYVPVAGGCRNSTNQSATLSSSGSIRVATDSLQLRAAHLPPNASVLLSQSTISTTQIPFGDGLRCIGGQILRLGILQASNGVATWPPSGGQPISTSGLVPATGGTRYYVAYYRDVAPYCTPDAFNMTDAQRIQWVP